MSTVITKIMKVLQLHFDTHVYILSRNVKLSLSDTSDMWHFLFIQVSAAGHEKTLKQKTNKISMAHVLNFHQKGFFPPRISNK